MSLYLLSSYLPLIGGLPPPLASGQFLLMCPFSPHMKHLPSLSSRDLPSPDLLLLLLRYPLSYLSLLMIILVKYYSKSDLLEFGTYGDLLLRPLEPLLLLPPSPRRPPPRFLHSLAQWPRLPHYQHSSSDWGPVVLLLRDPPGTTKEKSSQNNWNLFLCTKNCWCLPFRWETYMIAQLSECHHIEICH